ncbi:CAP domain-containing protein [Methanoregula sp.]|uniref:CAP domain-containing protein n=1 Tax=Methanoregula sp. TaxID=2052170 RepID=UPI00236D35CD|nr:CAP domain-containing protein [Methanoregula sp.]MDD1686630.1 CAP domain-containing protein [Methanoregula sp.]
MARKTCTHCGAITDDSTQKFCTRCGVKLPDLLPVTKIGGIPVRALVGALVLVVIIVIAVVAASGLLTVFFSSPSAGSATTGQAQVEATTSLPSLPTTTPLPTTPEIPVTTKTMVPTTVPTTAATTVTTKQTQVTGTPSPTYTVTTQSPVATGTSQITLAVTQVPSQPDSSSYTSSHPDAPYIDPSALETRIHELINIERQYNGLSPLSYDSFLADIARGHSYDMSLRNFFDHTTPDGRDAHARGNWAGYPCIRYYGTYYTEGISENLYQGYRYQTYLTAPNGTIVSYNWSSLDFIAKQAVIGWMNSEGHRENILNEKLQQEGIGVAFSSDDKIYVTENFC